MSSRKLNGDSYERIDRGERDDIVGQDLSQFAEAYLKSLLLHNPHPTNLLLPPTAPEDNPDLDTLYDMLNDIVDSSDAYLPQISPFASPSFKTSRKPVIEIISEEQQAPRLLQDESSNSGNLLLSIKHLTMRTEQDDEEVQLQELNSKRAFCWG